MPKEIGNLLSSYHHVNPLVSYYRDFEEKKKYSYPR